MAVSIKLLLLLYEKRHETKQFQINRKQLKEKYLLSTNGLVEYLEKIRLSFNIHELGKSRVKTDEILTSSLVTQNVAIFLFALRVIFSCKARTFVKSRSIQNLFLSFHEYLLCYRKKYFRRLIGKVWVPRKINLLSLIRAIWKGITISRLLFDKHLINSLEYFRELTELCYEYGLRAWWAPFIILSDDYLDTIVHSLKPLSSKPTIDGLLGPIFSRIITDTLAEHNKSVISSESNYEWKLISTPSHNMRKKFGLSHTRMIHQNLEKWGYQHGINWKRRDFDMLFERLVNHCSVDRIANDYHYDISTVQRQTNGLAGLLGLEFIPAPYKKHHRN